LNASVRGRNVLVGGVLVGILVVVATAVAFGIGFPGSGGAMAAAGAPRFVEESAGAGLTHSYEGGFEYFVGGGVAAFDCNDDALPELYLAGGSAPASLFVNRSGAGQALRFERLDGEQTDLDAVTGVYPIDIDGDERTDLAVLRHGENVLLRGLGECHFERANEAWSFEGGNRWSTAFSAKWDPGADWPTVAIGNYLTPPLPNNRRSCEDNELFEPAPAGDGFAAPQALSPGWCTLSVLFTDWDRSARRDLRVSNDRHYYPETSDGEEQLWRVAPGEEPRQYTRADGWQRVRVFGMGIGDYDVTADGYPDYYLTSQADNKLQVLADGPDTPTYEDVALSRGVTAQRPVHGDTNLPSTAWHAEFQDVNNDTFADLFVAKGNVEAMLDFAARDPSNLFIGHSDGTFQEVSDEAGTVDYGRARGAAMVDLNRDGMLDLVVVRRLENVLLFRNVGSGSAEAPIAMGNWIELDLHMDGPNRDAIGAWIEVRAGERVMQRELTVGGGHVSGELAPVHFGIGAAESAEVRITWPDGSRSDWLPVAANRTHVITPTGQPTEVSQP
jgi:hypothetical protein